MQEQFCEQNNLEEIFKERLRGGMRPTAEIDVNGIVPGAGTYLVRFTRGLFGKEYSGQKHDDERMLALLSVAYRRRVSTPLIKSISAASNEWRFGEKTLAQIRLSQAGLPCLTDVEDAYRLFLAEALLDNGMKPLALMTALGFDPAETLAKYDRNQPRVPAGNGRESGRWGSGGGGSGETQKPFKPTVTITEASARETHDPSTQVSLDASALAVPALGVAGTTTGEAIGAAAGTGEAGGLASGLFAAGETSVFLEGVAALGVAIGGVGAVLGVIFVPSPNDVTSEGTVPGDPDLHYHLDNDVGVLRLTQQTSAGQDLIAIAQRGKNGVFFENETGLPIARALNGSVVFDAASLADVAESSDTREKAGAATLSQAHADTDSPQLCPDPGPDVPHGASARAIAYQAQISALNNPQRPLPPGLAVSLPDPATGRRVVFDDCREKDGTMIEAKGPGYAKLLRSRYFSETVLPERWRRQAIRQSRASGDRAVDWFFAEETASAKAREIFEDPLLKKIRVLTVPAVMP